MKVTHPLPILLPLVLLVVSCSRTGDLSGDVFVTNGGRPVRGAGIEILVIRANERLESEFRKTIRDYDQQHGEAIKREEKECEKDKALEKQIENDPVLQEKADRYAKAEISDMQKSHVYVDPKLARFWGKTLVVIDLGGGKCPFVPIDRDAELDKLIHARAQELGRESGGRFLLADVNGHYEVNGLAVGRYYLSSSMASGETWLVPVQIIPGAQKVHLSNANSGSLRFLTKGTPDAG